MPDEASPTKPGWPLWAKLLVILGIVTVINIVRMSDEPQRTGSVSGRGACEHFHNTAVDYSDGVMTDSEFRENLQEVEGDAVGSPVEVEARAMLREFTTGTPEGFNAAVGTMSAACDSILDR